VLSARKGGRKQDNFLSNPNSGPNGGRTPGTVDFGKQAITLKEARSQTLGIMARERLELTSYPLFGYRLMNKLKDQPQARRQWYIGKLGKYDNQLIESAAANRIPLRLLAAIILNELLDIDPRDVLQQQLITNLSSGSLGVAQIEVSTVLRHNLLKGFLIHPNGNAAAQLLAVPQYSIEACARELRHLLDAMEADPKAAWPAFFNFVPPPASDSDPQRYYRIGVITFEGVDSPEEREAVFARMVASAYNGGDRFLKVSDPAKKAPNSWVHGFNAAFIARDLCEFDLFGP
jgi:hypothetical protein